MNKTSAISQPHQTTLTQRILCLWLPHWPIQQLVVSKPELRCQRVVLYRQDSRRGQLVAAVSPLALRDGVCVDMPLSEAKSLLKRNPGGQNSRNHPSPQGQRLKESTAFHIFEHDPRADLAALETLADSLETFSPIVGLEQIENSRKNSLGKTISTRRSAATAVRRRSPTARRSPANLADAQQPSSIFLDITGLAHLFGDEHQLAYQLYQHCDRLGYLPRIGIANTVGMAWGTARYLRSQMSESSDKPNAHPVEPGCRSLRPKGFVVLSPTDQLIFSQLPVAALRLEPNTIDTLQQLGIESVQQLLRLPRADLAMRFGDEIHYRLDQASGQIDEPVVARHKPPEFWAEQLLDYPTKHRETIEVIIARLVTDICQQIRGRQQGALQWNIRLVCQSRAPLEFQVSLFQPTATLNHIMPLIKMQLEQLLQPHTRKFRTRKSLRRTRVAHSSRPICDVQQDDSLPTGQMKKQLPSSPSSNFDSETSVLETGNSSSQKKTEPDLQSPGPVVTAESLPAPTGDHQFHRYTTIQVQEISVSVTSCVLLAEQQRQLFDENPRLDKQALAHLINRLSSRLGQQNVVYPNLRSGAQPEYSFRFLTAGRRSS